MVATAILAAAAMQFDPWLTFTRWPSSPNPTEIIEVVHINSKGRGKYLFKRRLINNKVESVWWTDTNKCPAAKSVLFKVQQLTPPRIHIPFLESSKTLVSIDGTTYQIKTLAKYPGSGADDISFSSNVGTPLAKWVDESLKALTNCWSKSMPVGPK